ncbi:MAG: glycoside hydrolase family 127 protein, partial [bacterium]
IDEGTDHNQDRIPFRKQQKAVGHAVRANYLYAGVADIYAETGDESLLSSLKRIWEDVVSTKMYITGACGALYDGVSPDGTSYNPQEIQQVHQAYGRPYQLPSITAHNESCATIGSILWNWRMFKLQPQAKFMDIIERTLYNGLLAATDLDGQKYLYTNPLRVARDLPFDLRWSDQRKKFIECYCCPPNIVRTIAEVNNMVYSISENGIWINLYGGNVLETELTDGSKIKLKQETDYPWSGEIKILVITAPPEEISLNLRIPDWAQDVSIAVNGKKVDKPESGKYFRINKKWSQGDLIELNIPLTIDLVSTNPLVEETFNQVAIKRGPLVYCLEDEDLPEDVRVTEIVIPRDIDLKPVNKIINGHRIEVLKGEARLIEKKPGMNKNLFQKITANDLKTININLLPYYCWGNRGKSEIMVWMRLGW